MSILALHGFTGCGADFAPFADLCGGNWRCPDLPGHGSNAAHDSSPQAIVNFIQSEASALSPLPSALKILLGYSMGARAALCHATQHPKAWDALILISGNPGIESSAERAQRRSADEKLAASIEAKGVAAFLEFWQQTPLIRSQANIPAAWRACMQANRSRHSAKGLANSLRQFGQGSVPNLWPEMSELNMPVCLITGELDSKYTEIAQRLLPSCHKGIANASHMPQLEQADLSSTVIQKFTEQLCR